MELLGELAVRFPKGADDGQDKMRIRLLAEDLSETMDVGELAAAIKVGKLTWRFLPTLAEIVEAGADFRAERRDRSRQAHLEQVMNDLRRLASPAPFDEGAHAALIAETFAKIDAGTAKLLGTGDRILDEPLTWRLQRENGGALLPQTIALRQKIMGF